MQTAWNSLKAYYFSVSESYGVDPAIFIIIHVIATPLFIASSAWLIKSFKKQRPVFLPILTTAIIYNIANIYVLLFGKNIPWFIYAMVVGSALLTGWLAYKKIKKKLLTRTGTKTSNTNFKYTSNNRQ